MEYDIFCPEWGGGGGGGRGTPHIKEKWGCSSSRLGVYISAFGLTQGVLGKTPSYLAVKVSFRVAREKI